MTIPAGTNFLGIPVEGDYTRSSRTEIPQQPVENLGPLLKKLLETEGVEAVRWSQYTPYFNDGEPCEFGTGEVYVKLAGDEDGGDWGDGFHDSYHFRPEGEYVGKWPNRKFVPKDPENVSPVYTALQEFDLGPFQDVLLDAFGDHAQVTVTREKITVESYDHD